MAAELIILPVLALAGLVAARFLGSDREVLRRAVQVGRACRIDSFPEQKVGKIVGRLERLSEALVAPLSGRSCLYYRAEAQEYREGAWRTIVVDKRAVEFLVNDKSGVAIVDVSNAELALYGERTTRSGRFDKASPAEEGFLGSQGLSSEEGAFNRQIRYSEVTLEVGAVVAIRAHGHREIDPSAAEEQAYRAAAPMRLRMAGTKASPLRLCNHVSTHMSA